MLGNILQTQQSDLNLIKGIKGKIEKRKWMTATKEERKMEKERWRKKDGKEEGLQLGGGTGTHVLGTD